MLLDYTEFIKPLLSCPKMLRLNAAENSLQVLWIRCMYAWLVYYQVKVATCLYQELYALRVTLTGGVVEGGEAVIICSWDACSVSQLRSMGWRISENIHSIIVMNNIVSQTPLMEQKDTHTIWNRLSMLMRMNIKLKGRWEQSEQKIN